MAIITPTDQTVQVAKGTKLDVNNFAGDVIVKVWDKDAVRVEVTHSDREAVDIKQGDQIAHGPLALAARRPAAIARLHHHRAEVDGDQRQRHLRGRDDGRRRRRRDGRDHARRHQGDAAAPGSSR